MKKLLIPFMVLCIIAQMTIGASAITLADLEIGKVTTVPTIDGVYNADEGWGDPVASVGFDDAEGYISDASYAGNADVIPTSAKAYLRWDDEHLYFCAVVVDPIHYNDCTSDDAANAWAGDAIQFDIKSDAADEDTAVRNRFFYGVNNDGELIAYQDKVEDGADWEIGADCAWDECVVVRDEANKTTTYETAFSWAKTLPSGKVSENSQVLVRAILLLTTDSSTEDCCDLNFPGVISGDYAYWRTTLAGQPAAELAAIAAAEAADTEAETAAETAAAAESSSPAAQTADVISISAVTLLCAAAIYVFNKKKSL